MAEIKEINTLNTVASVRRAAQQSMRPVIQEIQRKMALIEEKMQQITQQMFEFTGIQKKMQRNEQSNRYLHGQLLELSDSIHNAELQMAIDREKMEKIDQNYREEIRKLQRERQKQDEAIHNIEIKNAKAMTDISEYLKSMKTKEAAMQNNFHDLIGKSEKLRLDSDKNKEEMKAQFDEMRHNLNYQLKQSSRRLQLLDMYEVEKELSFQKFTDIYTKIEDLLTLGEFESYKQCNVKEQERVVDQIKKILEENLSEQTRKLIGQLPCLKQQLQHCLGFESEIKDITLNITQIDQKTHSISQQSKDNHQEIKQSIHNHLVVLETQRRQMQQDIKSALALEGLIQTKIDQYSDTLKAELRAENQRKSRELYEEIKVTFADTREAMRERELQRIVDERKKLFERCSEIETLGNRIQYVLTNFSTKFTKIKSDNELFEERVSKQLQKIQEFQFAIKDHNSLIGRTLSEVVQAILAIYCMQIDENSSSQEEILLTTLRDGVIYQKFSNSQDRSGILYRRKLMDPSVLRKAVAFSLLQIYDELMKEGCCLRWEESSPRDFFKQTIEPIYLNLNEKKETQKQAKVMAKYRDTVDLSTIQARQTISSFEQSQSRNISTMRSRRNRYSSFEGGEIFKHKSTRRVRVPLNTTLGIN